MASESGTAQTCILRYMGVEDPAMSYKTAVSGSLLERGTAEGDSPVRENRQSQAGDPEYHGAR